VNLAHPLALAGLVALPLAWLLGRLRRRPLEITVPSLLLWDRIPPSVLAAAPPRGLRRVDLRLALELSALALLVVGAAGPEIAAAVAPPRTVALAIDDRAALAAVDAGGRVRFESVRAAARERIRTLGKRDRVILAFASEDAPRPPLGPADALAAVEAAAPSRNGGADLEAAVAACRASPEVDIVHVLGRGDAPEGAGPDPDDPAWNAGIVAAGSRPGPDGRLQALVVVVAHGSDAPTIHLRAADPPLDVTVPGGAGRREMLLDLGPRTTPVTLAIEPGGSLALDDRVTLAPPAAAPRVVLTTATGARPEPRLRDALHAAGADLVETGTAHPLPEDAILVAEGLSGPAPRPARAVAAIAAAAALPADAPAPERIRPRDGSPFRHADLSGVRVRVAPAPPPSGLRPAFEDERGRPVAGTLEDERGRLVWIGFPLDPGASDWTKDRSFPIFWAEALAWLAARDGPARGLWTGDGLLDEAETRAAAEKAGDGPATFAPPRPRADGAPGAVPLGPWFLALGGVALAGAWAIGAVRRPS